MAQNHWKFPKSGPGSATHQRVKFKTQLGDGEHSFLPYLRDEKLARPWAIPGTPGLERIRIGGLEKAEYSTGNVSYDPENHQLMINIRQGKSRQDRRSLSLYRKLTAKCEKGGSCSCWAGEAPWSDQSSRSQLQREGAMPYPMRIFVTPPARPFPKKGLPA